jgi:hypothetical protein
MNSRHNPESHNDNRRRAAELHNVPAHAHTVAEQHGKQDHLSGPELSRQALEESQDTHRHAQSPTIGHGVTTFGHDDIAALAYQLWRARGCPEGSPEEDWFHAAEQLRSRAHTS